jgi:hypothetical protein
MYILNLHACVQKRDCQRVVKEIHLQWFRVDDGQLYDMNVTMSRMPSVIGILSAMAHEFIKEKYHQQARTTTYRNHGGLYCPLGLARGFPEICLKKQEWSKNWQPGEHQSG